MYLSRHVYEYYQYMDRAPAYISPRASQCQFSIDTTVARSSQTSFSIDRTLTRASQCQFSIQATSSRESQTQFDIHTGAEVTN